MRWCERSCQRSRSCTGAHRKPCTQYALWTGCCSRAILTQPVCSLQEGIRCLHMLEHDTTCATETIVDGKWLGKYTYYNYTVDHEWINERAPEESSWRYGHGHNHQGRL